MNVLELVKNILITRRGKHNSITSAEIARIAGIQEDSTHSNTRELIYRCARKYDLPLAAGGKGYYLITNQEEYHEYMDNLNARCRGLQERKRIITKNYKKSLDKKMF